MTETQRWYREVYLKSEHWQQLRGRVLTATPCCAGCGTDHRLQVHHLRYGNLWQEELGDMMVLCSGCHKKTHQLWDDPPRGFTSQEIRTCLSHFLYYTSGQATTTAQRSRRNHAHNKLNPHLRKMLSRARRLWKAKNQPPIQKQPAKKNRKKWPKWANSQKRKPHPNPVFNKPRPS